MLYDIYIYIHIFDLLIKFPIFSKNFSARRTYGSAVEQASTKPGPKPEIFLVLWLEEALRRLLQAWAAWDDRGMVGWTQMDQAIN